MRQKRGGGEGVTAASLASEGGPPPPRSDPFSGCNFDGGLFALEEDGGEKKEEKTFPLHSLLALAGSVQP